VLRLDRAAPERDRTRRDARDAEPVQRDRGAREIDDRVDRADLVKVHLRDRRPVHARLRARERLEARERALAHRVGELRALEHADDLAIGAAVVVTVSMATRSGHAHIDVQRGEDPAPHAPHDEAVVEAEAGEIRLELFAREARVEQRAEQHVPGHPGEDVEVEYTCAGFAPAPLPGSTVIGSSCTHGRGGIRLRLLPPYSRLMSVAT
jgi:hypothetical protein